MARLLTTIIFVLLVRTSVQGSEPGLLMNTKTERYETALALGLMEGFPPPPDKRIDRYNALFGVPYNRWSYQNMRRIYPSAPVLAAKEAFHLPRQINSEIETLTVQRENGTEADLLTFLKETYTDAFVVLHKGTVVYERYLNGMTADTPHQLMSVTKSFAGLLALMAASEGLMDEEDLVTQWVPELKDSSAFSDARVGHLLNMTNSMAFTEDYHNPESDIQKYGRVLGLFGPQLGEQLPDNLYDYLVTLEKGVLEHGEQYEYQTPKADVLNWVTNRVSGLSFEKDLAKRLWSRLGTDGETYVLLDQNGNLFAGGGG
ncbi:serine hydrolase [Pseudomonadales bacterium]|nr:serine hydrolase [Pseudomonadales bacterium]